MTEARGSRAPGPPGPGRLDGDPAVGDARIVGHACDLCGAEMYEFHCRLICPRCGFQRDCSDP